MRLLALVAANVLVTMLAPLDSALALTVKR